MAAVTLNLAQAAAHVYMDPNELRHAAQRGELNYTEHGGDWHFRTDELDDWSQRHLLESNLREQRRRHEAVNESLRVANRTDWRLADLFRAEGIELRLEGKAKAGILREMSGLAARTGLVYDPEGLFGELKEREEQGSTAIGAGAAFPHPRFRDPYLFEETFVAYGRSPREVFFGAPDGAPTRHYFLVCATDHVRHLRILSRLAVMVGSTDLLARLDAAADADAALAAIRTAEEEILT